MLQTTMKLTSRIIQYKITLKAVNIYLVILVVQAMLLGLNYHSSNALNLVTFIRA